MQDVEATGTFDDATATAPLRGLRVLITRAEEQAADFVVRLRRLGAEPVLCPTIQTVAPDDYSDLDAALANLSSFDWLILTSANGVRFTLERMEALRLGTASFTVIRIAAIGPATADALAEHGLIANFVPRRHTAEGLLEEIGDVAGMTILLSLADIARSTLADGLRERGAHVVRVTAYRTIPVEQAAFAAWLSEHARWDIATFTSSSTVRNFVELAGVEQGQALLRTGVVACIGPVTAQTARGYGMKVDVVADEHTTDGLLRALVAYVESQKDVYEHR